MKAESDIDLILLGDVIPRQSFAKAQWFNPARKAYVHVCNSLYPQQPAILSPVLLSEQGWLDAIGLRLSISEQSWILWDDGFLSQSIHETQQWIKEGKWSRVVVATGGWFWVPQEAAA